MKKICTLSTLLLLGMLGYAQQEIMVSQYMFNGLFINPGYAGSHKFISSSILHRNQWLSFEGAPKTYLLAVDGPFMMNKMGLGLIASHDEIGVTSVTDVNANYSYNIKVNSTSKLAFGIRGGLMSYKANFDELVYWDQDNLYDRGPQNMTLPKLGGGLYYYGKRHYAGLSIPTMLTYDKEFDFNLDVHKASNFRRHYFLNAGYVLDVNEYFRFKPSFLIKYLPNAPVQTDMNLSVMYKDAIWLGISYRSNTAVIGIIEYQVDGRLRIGYSYDMTTNAIGSYSGGSHEIMIGYDFGQEVIKIKTPRFF